MRGVELLRNVDPAKSGVEKIWMKNRAAEVVLVGPVVEYRRADRTKDYTLVVSKVTKLWPSSGSSNARVI